MGGAVAIDLASRNSTKVVFEMVIWILGFWKLTCLGQINALILENTFTSLPSLVPHALPVLGPLSFLCHQKWDSASKIPLIPATTPILMLSGVKDEIVPKEHMRRLWEVVAKRGEKKTLNGSEYKTGLERAKYIEFERGTHSTLESHLSFLFDALFRMCFNFCFVSYNQTTLVRNPATGKLSPNLFSVLSVPRRRNHLVHSRFKEWVR